MELCHLVSELGVCKAVAALQSDRYTEVSL